MNMTDWSNGINKLIKVMLDLANISDERQEKEMFIHMMQNMMFDRYGVVEVNADEDSD